MYHQYFGLSEPAFAIAVNPKYLYMSRQHKEAIAHLIYGIQGGGFVLLSGEVGTGKTTIIRQVLNQLPENTEIAFVLNPMAETQALLASICEELHINHVDDNSSIKYMMGALQQHLLNNFSEGKRTVLIIDEAQLLSAEVLEQIRLLTNLETETEKLLQIILVGQPEINDILAQPRLRQLSQRITARFHLTPLSAGETKHYIDHRLQVAGLKEGQRIFPNHIVKRVHQFSGGVPRLINILCERMLVGAYGHNCFQVNTKIYQLALNEIKGVKSSTKSKRFAPYIIAGSIVLCVALAGTFFYSKTPFNDKKIHAYQDQATVTQEANNQVETRSSIEVDATIKNESDIETPLLFSLKSRATLALFRYYNVSLSDETFPCWQTDFHGLSCKKESLDTWQAFEKLNRPAILTIITEEKNLTYALVIGSTDDALFLIDELGDLHIQNKDALGKQWNGELIYLWRSPEGLDRPLVEGMQSPVVEWVAKQFSILDGQDRPITREIFSAALKTRVQIFQANNGLENDGVIGERTIMKLNEKLGLSPMLIHSLPQFEQGY